MKKWIIAIIILVIGSILFFITDIKIIEVLKSFWSEIINNSVVVGGLIAGIFTIILAYIRHLLISNKERKDNKRKDLEELRNDIEDYEKTINKAFTNYFQLISEYYYEKEEQRAIENNGYFPPERLSYDDPRIEDLLNEEHAVRCEVLKKVQSEYSIDNTLTSFKNIKSSLCLYYKPKEYTDFIDKASHINSYFLEPVTRPELNESIEITSELKDDFIESTDNIHNRIINSLKKLS